MKIMLFRDGQRGVVIKLPGARPLEEIGELLGGAGLPTRYELHREPVAGDCAVAAMGTDGRRKDRFYTNLK